MVRLSGRLALNPGRSAPFSPGDGDDTRPTAPCFAIRAQNGQAGHRTHAVQGRRWPKLKGDRLEWPVDHRLVVLERTVDHRLVVLERTDAHGSSFFALAVRSHCPPWRSRVSAGSPCGVRVHLMAHPRACRHTGRPGRGARVRHAAPRAGRRGALRRRPAVRAGVGGANREIRCTPWRAMVRLSGRLALKSGRSARISPGDGDGTRPTVPCFAIRAHERTVKQATVRTPFRAGASRPRYARRSGPEQAGHGTHAVQGRRWPRRKVEERFSRVRGLPARMSNGGMAATRPGFANPSLSSGWMEDLHIRAVGHARRRPPEAGPTAFSAHPPN